MTYDQYVAYTSEIEAVEHLLQSTPDDRAIERMNLLSRINHMRGRIARIPVPPKTTEDRTLAVIGTIIEVFPYDRSFQLNTDKGDPITGNLGVEINDPYQIGRQYNGRRVRAQVRTVRVGQRDPKHTLLSVSELPDPDVV